MVRNYSFGLDLLLKCSEDNAFLLRKQGNTRNYCTEFLLQLSSSWKTFFIHQGVLPAPLGTGMTWNVALVKTNSSWAFSFGLQGATLACLPSGLALVNSHDAFLPLQLEGNRIKDIKDRSLVETVMAVISSDPVISMLEFFGLKPLFLAKSSKKGGVGGNIFSVNA